MHHPVAILEDPQTELTFTGTHSGPLATPARDVPATGRRVTVHSASFMCFPRRHEEGSRCHSPSVLDLPRFGVSHGVPARGFLHEAFGLDLVAHRGRPLGAVALDPLRGRPRTDHEHLRRGGEGPALLGDLGHNGFVATEDDVRRLALALPFTVEWPSYGTPGFRVRDRLFTRLHEEPGVLVLWRPSVEDRDALIAADPEKFFTSPHYRGHPSVLLRLAAVDEAELAELLGEAWEVRAPRRRSTGA